MTGPTHALFATATGIALIRTRYFELDAISFLILIIGSLAPDIDSESGSITKPGKILQGILPRPFVLTLDHLGTLLSSMARSISGHRGLFHTPVVAFGLMGVAWYLRSPRFEWFAIGYMTHIFADACTKMGVPLLWPFVKKEISFSPIATGSLHERLLAICLILFVVFAGWGELPDKTKEGFNNIKQVIFERSRVR